MDPAQSFTFRIKPNSKLDNDLRFLLKTYPDGVTKTHLTEEQEWTWMRADTVFNLGRFSDNFTCGRGGVSYTDVRADTIIKQAQPTGDSASQAQPHNPEPLEDIRWPDVPRIGDTADYPWFRKPTWYKRMAAMLDQGKHISLAGPPGIGKSSAVEYMAAERSKVLVNVPADAGLRRRDMSGSVELVNGQTQFLAAEYATAAINGWWVKIDEVNAAEPDALMYLNSQIAPPYAVNFHGKSYPVHKDFRLFITYNPNLVGTKPLPEALKDRFFPIKLQFPNKLELRRMLEANGMPAELGRLERDTTGSEFVTRARAHRGTGGGDNSWTKVIIEYGARVWEQFELRRMRYQITPRRLMDAVTLVMACDENVYDALEAAVIMAVDNMTESQVMKETLSALKKEMEFGRI